MTKIRYSATGLMLILTLTFGVTLKSVDAAGDNPIEARLTRAGAGSSVGPIGRLVTTRSAMVNGRAVQGEELLWGGELLQAPVTGNVFVSLDSIGQVTLGSGAVARFNASRSAQDDAARRLLVGSLSSGEIDVRLNNEAGAYIEAAGSGFTATPGSSFSLAVRDGRAAVVSRIGEVTEQTQPQRRYILRPVGFGSTISVRARTTRQIQIQVTDENDKPVPDVPIIFALAGAGGKFGGALGSGASAGSSATATTNALGRATMQFTAGDSAGADSMTATVKDTNYSLRVNISVTPATFWSARNTLLTIGIAAAAGVAIGIVVTRDEEQVRPKPPIDVKP
ncbi:MAG TPA: hypothetical protein VJH03_13965 [Blastocatellia bacterium]|nr:hypothetical protein [Blastocatellia bacterium]